MMKKLFYFFVMLGTAGAMAQEAEATSRQITVNGNVEVKREIQAYRVQAVLSMDQVYYSDPTVTSFTALKNKYFQAVRDAGFDPEQFSEHPNEFLALGYQKEGTVLKYETDSAKELELLSKVRMTGITLSYEFKTVLEAERQKELLQSVLADAKQNATQICKEINARPGAIIAISGHTPKEETWISYLGNNYPEYWTLSVTYRLE